MALCTGFCRLVFTFRSIKSSGFRMDQTLNTMQEFNLSELVTAVAEKSTLNKTVVKEVLQEAINVIAENIPTAPKQRVEIYGFGVLKLIKHKESKWKLNGNEGITPAHFTVEFIPSPRFIEIANAKLIDPDGLVITK